MRKLARAALAAASLSLLAAPAAQAVPGPPTDVVRAELPGGCPPPGENPCDPEGGYVYVDKTYPSRLIAWAESVVK